MTSPPRNLAQLLLRKYGLSPPVDVQLALEREADLTMIESEQSWDAFSLKPPGQRAKVFVRKGVYRRRQRFSMAHELGHVVMPWHIGVSVSLSEEEHLGSTSLSWLVEEQEREADEFASEFLLPTDWLRELVGEGNRSPGEILDLVEGTSNAAEVSSVTAARALANLFPTPVGIRMAHETHNIYSYSPSFHLRPGDQWDEIVSAEMGKLRARVDSRSLGSYDIDVITLDISTPPAPPAADVTAGQILKDILLLVAPADQIASLTSSINGIVGAVNPKVQDRSFDALYGALRQRFAAHPYLHQITAHPRFEDFLRQKAFELATDAGSKRRKGSK